MKQGVFVRLCGCLLVGAVALACGEDEPNGAGGNACTTGVPAVCMCSNGQSGTVQCVNGAATGCSCQNSVGIPDAAVSGPGGTTGGVSPSTGGAGAPAGGGTPGGAMTGGAMTGGAMTGGAMTGGAMPGGAMTGGAMTGGGAMPGGAAVGPKDGDPSKPVVMVEGVPCRQQAAGTGGGGFIGGALGGIGGGSSANAMVGGRELVVDYPCGKHEGAQMTVILNLHGTLIQGAPYTYQRGYFSAYRFVNSHNLIVLNPKSVSTASLGAQWGNMDNGEDEPHLLAVIEWVYTTFSKFQLRGLWVAGHSWGAAYATGGRLGRGFVCHAALQDKAKGAIGMSGAGVPPCADRVSLISTRGSMENIPLLDQSRAAMGHGCDGPMMGPEMIGNNERRFFGGCDPAWVHDDYNMLGKAHTDFMDQEVVKKIVDTIKATEL
jgi:hypothetical protein